MGLVSDEESRNGLDGAFIIFSSYIEKIDSIKQMSIFVSYAIVTVLGTYLYGMYYKCGIKKSKAYSIVGTVVSEIYREFDDDIAYFIDLLVATRNKAVHEGYIKRTDDKVLTVLTDSRLVKLLRYEGVIDVNGKFIVPNGNRYEPVTGKVEARSRISSAIARVNAEDEELKK